jgi:putative endonuclease
MQVTVYMLRCADGSYYTGLTRGNVEARVWEHNNDPIDSYTAKRRPVALVVCEIYERLREAIARERQIKSWTRRKKEALIRGDYETLPVLSSRPSPE